MPQVTISDFTEFVLLTSSRHEILIENVQCGHFCGRGPGELLVEESGE